MHSVIKHHDLLVLTRDVPEAGLEAGDVGMAVQRAEDKTAQMQARAGAVDALLASGALDDVTAEPNADISAELAKLTANSSVDAELAKMKAELGSGSSGELPKGES